MRASIILPKLRPTKLLNLIVLTILVFNLISPTLIGVNKSLAQEDNIQSESLENPIEKAILKSDIYIENKNNLIVGRDEKFNLTFSLQNVGALKAKNIKTKIFALNLKDFIPPELLDPKKYIPDILLNDVKIAYPYELQTEGYVIFHNLELNPLDTFKVIFPLRTERFHELEKSYMVSIQNVGNDSLDNNIEPNSTQKDIEVKKLDNTKPGGAVMFKKDGNYVYFINDDRVSVEVQPQDIPDEQGFVSKIIAVRFSLDSKNFVASADLPKCSEHNCGFDDNGWNSWDRERYEVNDPTIKHIGKNYRYMQVMDLYGNIGEVRNYFVKDTTSPIEGKIYISPREYDLSNPEFTSNKFNFITFAAKDNDIDELGKNIPDDEISNLGFFSYSFDGINFSEWREMKDGLNSIKLDFPKVNAGEKLKIFLKIKDRGGNNLKCDGLECILTDEIIFNDDRPEINLALNDNAEFTNNPKVKFTLNLRDTNSIVNKIRFGSSIDNVENQPWLDFDKDQNEYPLFESFKSGKKILCAQVKDNAESYSEISCDDIILDNKSPVGGISIEKGKVSVQNKNVVINLDAEDPSLEDGTHGSKEIMMRLSTDGIFWSDFEKFSSSKDFELEIPNGENIVYVQYQDKLGNESEIYKDSIILNPLGSDGHIVINDDDLFTDVKTVKFKLSHEKKVILMRFKETSGGIQQDGLPDMVWTHWEEFVTDKQWEFKGEYSQKNLFVQYMFVDGSISDIYKDSIIYAPYYGIEYINNDELSDLKDSENKLYGLKNIPGEVLSQDFFTVKLNVRNSGSFTWPLSGDNPVHISYRWIEQGGNGGFGAVSTDSNGGNRAMLTNNIAWNEETGELTLTVDTPDYPGDYKLQIDTIHEGITWFSFYNNPTPEFNIHVLQNPDKVLPDIDYSELPANSGGRPGEIRVVTGRWEVDPDFRYQYRLIDNGVIYHFIYRDGERYLGKQVEVTIRYTDSINYIILAIKEVAKTWKAGFYSQIPKDTINIFRGDSINVRVQYLNNGTGEWTRGATFLKTTTMQNSPFASGWLNENTINLDNQNVYQGNVGWFTFNFKIPSDFTPGIYRECFNVMQNIIGIISDKETCFNLNIMLTEAEEREYRCNQPQNVFNAINGNIIGQLNSGDKIVVFENKEDWIRIYFNDNYNAWVPNSDECFEFITNVPNPIPKTVVELPQAPNGDEGYITAINGIAMHEGPAESFPIVDFLRYGDKVRVLSETKPIDGYSGWIEIEKIDPVRGKLVGWIPKGFVYYIIDPKDKDINLNPPYRNAHVCLTPLTVKNGPGFNYSTKTVIGAYTNFKIIYEWAGWYQIYFNQQGEVGWVNKNSGVCKGFYNQNANYTGRVRGITFFKGLEYIPPVTGRIVTSPFGSRPNDVGAHDFHPGVDYIPQGREACGEGILATADGTVVEIVSNFGSGGSSDKSNYIIIEHPNNTKSLYWHLKEIYVTNGQSVKRGELIGTIGDSGTDKGCHLHFEIWADKNSVESAIDPETLFNQPEDGIGGGDSNLPYGDFNINKVDHNANVEGEIDKDGNFRITKFDLPAPDITFVETEFGTGQVNIYGTGVNKNFVYNARAKIHRTTININEASKLCGISPFLSSFYVSCISEKMGLTQGEYTQKYAEISRNCLQLVTCIWSTNFTNEFVQDMKIQLQNVELMLLKNGIEDITQKRICNIGEPCHNGSGRYWHDKIDGTWNLAFDKSILKANDRVKSKLRIFGDYAINYKNKRYIGNWGNGWESGYSGEMIVPNIQDSFKSVVTDPVQKCPNVGITSWFGKRTRGGREEFHNAIDLGGIGRDWDPLNKVWVDRTCPIVAVYNGKRSQRDNYAGNTVFIQHNDQLSTVYGHGKEFIHPEKNYAIRSEEIMYMGRTGDASGVHLHFEVRQNNIAIDPMKYFDQYFKKYPVK